MPEPTTSEAAAATTTEDQAIRERVKALTSELLQQGTHGKSPVSLQGSFSFSHLQFVRP
jgi:hypothetical protein